MDLGTYKITADAVEFSLSPLNAPGAGQISYIGNTGALTYLMNGSNVPCSIGQTLHALVHNADSVTILKGQPVYLFGASGNKASVKLANNTSDATSAKTFGLAAEDITSGQNGFVICQGVIDGLNTGMYSAGDTLYVGATAGALTNVKPYAPNHLVYIGIVEKANAGNGQIYVRPQNGYELDEIHDVDLITTAPVNNDVLTYVTGSPNLWKPKSVSSILGFKILTNNTGTYSVTGTTAETIAYEVMIPANTISSGSIEFDYIAIRVTGTAGSITSRIKVSTVSGTLGTLISSTSMSGSNYWMKPRRTMVYKSATSSLIIATNSNQVDDSVVMTINPPTSSINIDWTVNQYIQFTLQNASAADTSALQFASIKHLV